MMEANSAHFAANLAHVVANLANVNFHFGAFVSYHFVKVTTSCLLASQGSRYNVTNFVSVDITSHQDLKFKFSIDLGSALNGL